MTNEARIWAYLKQNTDWTEYGIAGLMGNMRAESAFEPKNLQDAYEKKLGYTNETYTAAVDSGAYTNFAGDSAGYGLCQWTHPARKKNMLAYFKAAGKSIGDLEAQCAWCIKEMKESYAAVYKTLQTATDTLTASNRVLFSYEQPANQSESAQNARNTYSRAVYNSFHGTEQKTTESATEGTTAETTETAAKTQQVSTTLPTLRFGSRSEAVKKLQLLLNYHEAGLTVDGQFGNGTLAAVKKIQTECGIDADGIAGPMTWAAIINKE